MDLITKNETGQILDQRFIPEPLRGEFYENEVRDCAPEYLGDDCKELVAKNNKGEEIGVLKVRPTHSHLIVDHFNKQFELGDFRRSTTLNDPLKKEHILNVVSIEDQIYLSKIMEKKNPKQQTATLEAFVYTVPQNECIL